MGLHVSDPSVLETLEAYLPPLRRPAGDGPLDWTCTLDVARAGASPPADQFHQLYSGPERVAATRDWVEACETLGSILDFTIARFARDVLFVHAGAVGWQDRAILMPGPTRSGKTSLVTALVRAGATYYSDEFAVIDAEGRTHPYPRPLSIRRRGRDRGTRVGVQEMGGRTGVAALDPGLVLVAQFEEGAEWRPRRLTPGQTTLALIQNTVLARHRSGESLATLASVATRASGFQGGRGEADLCARAVLATCDFP